MSNEIEYAAVAGCDEHSKYIIAGDPAGHASYSDANSSTIAKSIDEFFAQETFQEIWNKVTDAGPCSGESKSTTGCSGKCHLCGNRK